MHPSAVTVAGADATPLAAPSAEHTIITFLLPLLIIALIIAHPPRVIIRLFDRICFVVFYVHP
ncbi:uncharacterized protein EDB91DRAFT_1253523 [Suillus paluster]|uniref:uncharacterized protein n=1 Tax=Suillus paluster TaxID=48578 RepID=UPI001B886393|nr:uncharacterized protein EDB91DRAFT_1253523 [Suillus paluster]KAG1728258.1 hypothetical protein EDB91DRAFT_1253523 [Suillus paluster]